MNIYTHIYTCIYIHIVALRGIARDVGGEAEAVNTTPPCSIRDAYMYNYTYIYTYIYIYICIHL